MNMRRCFIACAAAILALSSHPAIAQSTAFTYQGKLSNGGVFADGNYDFQYLLFDALSGGSQLGSTVFLNGVAVTSGIFSVNLDFGDLFPGAARYLEIRVRASGSAEFTTLSPRQTLTSIPYAIKSKSADEAATATNSEQLGGVSANQYVLTGDARLSDARSPLPNSPNYIQNTVIQQAPGNFNISGNGLIGGTLSAGALTGNGSGITNLNASNIGSGTLPVARGGTGLSTPGISGNFLRSNGTSWTSSPIQGSDLPTGSFVLNTTTQQPSSNFSISGNGTAGGTLSADIVRATTQYNIGGLRVLSIGGTNNLSVGPGAGTGTGTNNTFVGEFAGSQATTSQFNSVFGAEAGYSITTNGSNAFFGYRAGRSASGASNSFFGTFAGTDPNLSLSNSGTSNTFIGYQAGTRNTTGSSNTFVGREAGIRSTGFGNQTGSQNTYIGANASGLVDHFNSTAIGYRAQVSQDNSLVLGSIAGVNGATETVNVGIGTGAPSERLHVAGNGLVTGNLRVIGDSIVEKKLLVPAGAAGAPSISIGSSNTGLSGAGGLILSTDGSERMRIDYDGNVLIGSSVPVAKLYVVGDPVFNGNLGIIGSGTATSPKLFFDLSDTNTGLYRSTADTLNFSTNGVSRVQIGSTGNVGIGTTSPSGKLHVIGDIRVTQLGSGSVSLCWNSSNQISLCSSSLRYKANIRSFKPGLDLIKRLRPVSFNWKAGGVADFGLIAEEAAQVEPLLAVHNTDGKIEGVKYDRVGVVLVNAVKEQQSQIESQKERIDRLTEIIKLQRAEIDALKSVVCAQDRTAGICRPKN